MDGAYPGAAMHKGGTLYHMKSGGLNHIELSGRIDIWNNNHIGSRTNR